MTLRASQIKVGDTHKERVTENLSCNQLMGTSNYRVCAVV